MTYKVIRTVLLFILYFTFIVLLKHGTAIAEDHVECNYLQDIERFTTCEVYNAWGYDEVAPLVYVIEKESGWDNVAQNPSSTAFGIAQFLDSTWELVGHEKTTDPKKQILAMIDYVDIVYETPSNAKQKHLKANWY